MSDLITYPNIEEWTAEGMYPVSGLIPSVQCTESDDEKCGGILSGIRQMRMSLFRVFESTETLEKSNEGGKQRDDWSNSVGVGTAEIPSRFEFYTAFHFFGADYGHVS